MLCEAVVSTHGVMACSIPPRLGEDIMVSEAGMRKTSVGR